MTEIEQPSPVDQLLDAIRDGMTMQTEPFTAGELAIVIGEDAERVSMGLDILVTEGYLVRSGDSHSLTPTGVADQDQRRDEGTRT